MIPGKRCESIVPQSCFVYRKRGLIPFVLPHWKYLAVLREQFSTFKIESSEPPGVIRWRCSPCSWRHKIFTARRSKVACQVFTMDLRGFFQHWVFLLWLIGTSIPTWHFM